jgi:hypothetical protein
MVNRVLCELFGEIVLNDPCSRQPRIVRPGVASGLELLDLILNPDHIVRTTEDLSFVGAQALRREFRVDVMLDRVSSHREAGVSQLAALLSERPVTGDPAQASRLWTPLLHVPRPIVVPIEVHDSDGDLLPRPPQREIRVLLEAALYHLLRESLHVDRDFEREDSELGRLMRTADTARWTLQAAVLAVCESGPHSPHGHQRLEVLLEATERSTLDQVGEDELAGLVERERDPDKRLALSVLHHKVSRLPALLELVELIYGNYFIIAGLDPARRDHSARFALPGIEASPSSPDRRMVHRLHHTLDPRDHHFTARIRLRVPVGVNQYRVQLTGSVDADGESETAMAVLAAVHLRPRPAGPGLAAIGSCRSHLLAYVAGRPEGGTRTTVHYDATEARSALDSLAALAGQERSLAGDLETRWSRVESRLFVRQMDELQACARALRTRIGDARARADALVVLTSPLDGDARRSGGWRAGVRLSDDRDGEVVAAAQDLADALGEVASAASDPRLDLHLSGDDAPGNDVGRVRVNRPLLTAAPGAEARAVDVWVTMADEAMPYAASVLLPPVALFAFLWLFGALLFEAVDWMYSYSLADGVRGDILDRQADALAAILLLIPGIAMSLVRMPRASSVRARLRRASRAQVYTAVAVLSVAAIVVATRAGSDTTERLDLLLILRVLRGAAWILLAWIVWSVCAWALRGLFVWVPKGLSRDIADRRRHAPRTSPPPAGARALRWFLGERKRADVEFEAVDASQLVPERLRLRGGPDDALD